MGLLDALSDLGSAVVKTALAPVAIIKDAANVAIGLEANATKELLKSAAEDMKQIGDDLES